MDKIWSYFQTTIDSVWNSAPNFLWNYGLPTIKALVIYWFGMRFIRRISEISEKTLTSRNMDNTIRPFFVSLIDVSLKLILFLVIANTFGFETTSFVVVLSSLAFAVGLALQGSLGHFASGILLLILKPYRVGDEIEVADTTGFVDEIQVFNTILRTRDNRKVIIPNGVITSGSIINVSGQGDRRVDMVFSVAENNDVDHVRRTLLHVIAGCPHVMKERPTEVFVNELEPDEMQFAVRVWCESSKYENVKFYMNEYVKKSFDEVGINDHVKVMHVKLEK